MCIRTIIIIRLSLSLYIYIYMYMRRSLLQELEGLPHGEVVGRHHAVPHRHRLFRVTDIVCVCVCVCVC